MSGWPPIKRICQIGKQARWKQVAVRPPSLNLTRATHMQAAARAVAVAQERSSNEAKSEFMSLMCHEVRTPLNGCLASAEMLLETDLQVRPPQALLSTIIRYCGCWCIRSGQAAGWHAEPGIVPCRCMLCRVCRGEGARRTPCAPISCQATLCRAWGLVCRMLCHGSTWVLVPCMLPAAAVQAGCAENQEHHKGLLP